MEEEEEEEVILKFESREDYPTSFDPAAYLRGFYTKKDSEPAINVILTFLPNVTSRLPTGGRLLDVGSGPTVHMALYFRNVVDEVYLSDFVPRNREFIFKWLKGDVQFDWSNVSKYISMLEGGTSDWREIENQGRQKVKDVFHCDVLQKSVFSKSDDCQQNFDIVTTMFCLEYATKTSDEYATAVSNVLALLKPGGYFVMGGCFEALWYKFGGKYFSCHLLKKDEMLDALKLNGIEVDDQSTFKLYTHEDIFLTFGRKKLTRSK